MAVSPIPVGYPRVSPYLIVYHAAELLEFMTRVFDATVIRRHDTPDGDVMHAEVRIGDAVIMVGGASEQWLPVPAAMHVYVDDVDGVYRRALDAGASSLNEPKDQFYGDRNAGVKDKSGNTWFISTHIEDVSEEEMVRRGKVEMEKRAKTGAVR